MSTAKFYTIVELAELLEISYQAVSNLVQEGEIEAHDLGRKGRHQWRISEASVQKFLQSRSNRPNKVSTRSAKPTGPVREFVR
jgi:excisionase family DNA binding protein